MKLTILLLFMFAAIFSTSEGQLVINIQNSKEYQSRVKNCDKPGLIIFSRRSELCNECPIYEKRVQTILSQKKSELLLFKIDFDYTPTLADLYTVRAIPSLHEVINGVEKAYLPSADVTDAQLTQFINTAIARNSNKKNPSLIRSNSPPKTGRANSYGKNRY